MAVIKQGGQTGLQKVTEETLQQRLNRLGLPQTTSGAAAQGLGATPDQAKMAGSAARKDVVLRQAADQSKNLMAAKEAQKAPGMLSEQEQAELTAAERLTKLGGASAQIGELALQKLKGAGQGPVQRQVTQTGESELAKVINPVNNPAGYNAAKSALVSYANDPSQLESALVTLRNLGIQDPESYLERTDQVLNRTVQTSGLTAAEMEPVIQQYGFADMNDLATTLGLTTAQIQGMSPTDISNQINAKRQELLDRTAQLQSQAGRTGLAGAAAQQQLQAFTQAGGIAREKEAARPTIDMRAKIKVGETEYDVENILKDEEFSQVIEQWLAAKPEDRANIIPGDWPLSQWLSSNEAALTSATQAGKAAGLQLTEAQKGLSSVKDAPKLALATVVPGFDPNKTYSSAEIQNMTQQWANSKFSKVGQAWLNGLSQAEMDQIKGSEYTEQDLKDMEQLSAPGNKIKAFLGIPDKNVYTKDELSNYKAYAALPEDVKPLMNNPNGIYKGLPASELAKFSGNPTLQREYEEWATERNKFTNMNIDSMSESDLATALYGLPKEELDKQLATLKDQERVLGIDYNFPADSNDDGRVDLNELRGYANSAKGNLAKPRSVDSFMTQQGFADYQPQAPKLDVNKMGTDPKYNVVKGWIDGDSSPSLGDGPYIGLAMQTLNSLPKGPTRTKLFNKMRASTEKDLKNYITGASNILSAVQSAASNTRDWGAYTKSTEDQRKALADSKKVLDSYPKDWPGLSDIKKSVDAYERKVNSEIKRHTGVRNMYVKLDTQHSDLQRKLAEIRAANTFKNLIGNTQTHSDKTLYRNDPAFREAYDKAAKLQADLKTYGNYGYDEGKMMENIRNINNSLGVKV